MTEKKQQYRKTDRQSSALSNRTAGRNSPASNTKEAFQGRTAGNERPSAGKKAVYGKTGYRGKPAGKYDFDAATGNRIRIDFEAVQASFVKLIFTMNSSSRTGGAQAAEICVY